MRTSFAPCSFVLAMTIHGGLLSSGCGPADDTIRLARQHRAGSEPSGEKEDDVRSAGPSSGVVEGVDEPGSTSVPPGGSYPIGTKLRTTADLNLRAGSNTDDEILLVMPVGSVVAVRQVAPVNGFYAVTYGNTDGWAHGSYLTPDEGALPDLGNPAAVNIGGPAVRAHVQSFANAACSQVGCPYEVGTYDGHDPSADRALDMMMTKAGTKPSDGGAHGTEVASFALDNGAKYKVMYVIWSQRINTQDGRGWRPMADRGSITQNHYDHVHVSFDP